MMLALDASMRIDSAHNTLVLDSVPDAEDSSVLITVDGVSYHVALNANDDSSTTRYDDSDDDDQGTDTVEWHGELEYQAVTAG